VPMDNKEKLLEMFNNDPLGLLDIKSAPSDKQTADERLIKSFLEVNEFVEKYGYEPKKSHDIHERKLYSRLKAIREDRTKIMALMAYDEYNLLPKQIEEAKEVRSIDDILSNDNLRILDDGAEEIFNIKHVPKETTMPDYVARRKPCKEFEKFEQIFVECQKDLKEGRRKLYPFKDEQQIHQGYFFVLKGVLLYVAEVGKREKVKGKVNARLRCIFENGTESDMLLRSLSAELYKDGRRVSEYKDRLNEQFGGITEEDSENGFIYILRSKSEDPKIKEIRNLYKIGFSTTPVEQRIAHAKNETTYLMAEVEVVAEYQCFNLNPQKFEQLLHGFFGKACLNIDIFDEKGNRHTPREWFSVPLDVVDAAIGYILSGEIVQYRYDVDREMITARQNV